MLRLYICDDGVLSVFILDHAWFTLATLTLPPEDSCRDDDSCEFFERKRFYCGRKFLFNVKLPTATTSELPVTFAMQLSGLPCTRTVLATCGS